MTSSPTLRIAAAVVTDERGRFLVVRKHGSNAYMQPGGKIDGAESPAEALVRELSEELGAVVEVHALEHIGEFSDVAVNEPGWRVTASVYRARLSTNPRPLAEIEELAWIDTRAPLDSLPHPLAPLTLQIIAALEPRPGA